MVTILCQCANDVGNVGWWRASECRACAVRYDRWPVDNGAVMQR